MTIESDAKIKPVAKVPLTHRFSLVMTDSIIQFEDAGLHPIMLKNIELCGYKVPTPIQAYCLPSILKNRDVIAVAQTGESQ